MASRSPSPAAWRPPPHRCLLVVTLGLLGGWGLTPHAPSAAARQPGSDRLIHITEPSAYAPSTVLRMRDDESGHEPEVLIPADDTTIHYAVTFHPRFADVPSHRMVDGVVPYTPAAGQWSDAAHVVRFLALPPTSGTNGRMMPASRASPMPAAGTFPTAPFSSNPSRSATMPATRRLPIALRPQIL